jgi:hypothetical protein
MSAPHDPFSERWHRFLRLAPEERGLVLRAMVLLSLTMLGLRTISFRRCKDLIQRFSLSEPSPRRSEPGLQEEMVRKIVSAMSSVERNGPGHPNCLERSLALWWMLRLNRIGGDLRIGGRKSQGRFEAHAWVEWGGHVLNDSTDVHKHYSRFDAPIAAAEGDWQ